MFSVVSNDSCRLCGESKNEILINVFEDSSRYFSTQYILKTKLYITITKTDPFSHSVCISCINKLEEYYNFVKKCQQTQINLFEFHSETMQQSRDDKCDTNLKSEPSVATNENMYEEFVGISQDENLITDITKDPILNLDNTFEVDLNDDNFICDISLIDEKEIICEESKMNLMNERKNNETNKNITEENNNKKIPLSKLAEFFTSKITINKRTKNTETEQNLNEEFRLIDVIDDQNIEESKINIDNERKKIDLNSVMKRSINEQLSSLLLSKSNEEIERISKFYELRRKNFYDKLRKSGSSAKRNNQNCPLCGMEFIPNEMKDHVGYHSKDEAFVKLILEEMSQIHFKHKLNYCSDCDRLFFRESLYLEHMNTHSKKYTLACHLCDRTFCIRTKLKTHLRAVHLVHRIKCEKCSYAAKNIFDLRKHMIGIHSNKQIICEVCGKSVSYHKSNYARHLETHSELRPYKCELCDASYKTAATLGKHRENIHFPKPVMCTSCGTISGSKMKYKKHARKCKKKLAKLLSDSASTHKSTSTR